MAKEPVSELLQRRSAHLRLYVGLLFAGLIVLQAGVYAFVISLVWGESPEEWLPELSISSAFLLVGGVLVMILITLQQRQVRRQIGQVADGQSRALNIARDQANALKALAAAIGSARSMESLFDLTLDVYQQVLNDLGVAPQDQTNAIYLLDKDQLAAVAARAETALAEGTRLDRRQGIAARTLAQAELLVTDRPDQDPALSGIPSLADRRQVICIPLCTAHGLYGLALLAIREPLDLSVDDTHLLEAIADQVAMALHNFQVHQALELTRIGYLAAEEDERRLVRRSLHEGPSRRVAAVALRLGLIRTMMIRDPNQAAQELHKMEAQTRLSSEELRNMVTYLRPLNLSMTDLERAVDTLLVKLEASLGLALRTGRRASGDQLSELARAIILYVLEGTLAWAKRYGQATAAEIHFWQEGDHFFVSVDDDGYAQREGQDGAIPRANDLAFEMIQAKASRIDGRLEITPKPGRGVTTTLVVPLKPAGLAG